MRKTAISFFYKFGAIIKYAGAFIAWVAGPGFATGQEIMRFFSSYGYASYGVVLLNLAGFLFLGQILLIVGFEHKGEEKFNHYKFYCGHKLGTVYSYLVPVMLVLIMAVLIAAAGATFYEYHNINRFMGSAIMAVLVLSVYLVGFEKMVNIVSKIGPVIIIFAILIGIVTLVNDFPYIREIGSHEKILASSKSTPNWAISAVLYLSLNFLTGSTYCTALGKSAKNRRDAKWGAIAGAIILILVITLINTAILLNAENIAFVSVPTLYLAGKISHLLGAAFSIVLLLGMFSSCSTMMWSFCNKFFTEGTWKNRLVAVITSIITFIIGLFPFRGLVGIFYPFIGYLGLVFIVCVLFRKTPICR